MKKIMGFMMGWIVVATIVSVPVLSQDNFDESEPNNTYEDAAIVSVDRFEGSISEDDVHDWFFLENLERGLFIFTINYSPDRGDLDFAVFNNGIYVDAGISVDSQDSITCFIDGDCYAHIYSYDGFSDYTFSIEPADPEAFLEVTRAEVERLLELSTPVSDSVIEGSIEGEDDEDWYVIEDLDTENIMFQIEYSVDECNIDFEVLSDIEVVGSALNFLSPDSVFCTVDGHCFVHVLSSQGTGDYTVTIQPSSFSDCEGPDEIEPNDYAHEYNVITSNVFEGYGCPGNFDWFMIEGLSGQDAQVTLYFDDRECRLSLSVCSDSEILDIISGTTSPAGGFYVIPGQCYIVVRSDWMEGAYRVEIDTVDEITE